MRVTWIASRNAALAAALAGLAGPVGAAALAAPAAAAAPATHARPVAAAGDGFFVADGELYDADGHAFRIRGVNRLHWDSHSSQGIARSHANTVRWALDFQRPAGANVQLVRADSIRHHIVPIVGNWQGTCSPDPAKLASIVVTWVAQARAWRRLERYLIVNIANEWGPADSPVWRDAYRSAIAQLRAAGYRGTLLIDASGCGQDLADLQKYSAALLAADPEHNLMFALHLYGQTNDWQAAIRAVHQGNPTVVTLASAAPTHPFAPHFDGHGNSYSGIGAYAISGARGMTRLNGTQPASLHVGGAPGAWTVTLDIDSRGWPDYRGGARIVDAGGNYALRIASLASLARRTGAAYLVGEFGPGDNIGPSPTEVTPREIIAAAEAHGIGWLAWAWDDVDKPGCLADDHWFSLTHACGEYARPADLTGFGREVVLDPHLGLAALAHPAALFEH